MHKIQKHIEIIRTTTKGFGSMGLESCDDIFRVLRRHYSRVTVRIVNEMADLVELTNDKPDLVFLGMKCLPYSDSTKPSEILWISEYLRLRDIAHIGSPSEAIELERDKPRAKQRVMEHGLSTPKFLVVGKDAQLGEQHISLQFPLFIKPANFGASIGIDENSIIYTLAELQAKVTALKQLYYADLLIEEYLPGREFSVSVLRIDDTSDYAVMPLELVAPVSTSGAKILSSRVKTLDIEVSKCIDDELLNAAVGELAVDIFKALGARDYGRIDIRLNAFGKPYFLEANLVPSLKRSPGNYFPKACLLNIGMDYETMLLSIVRLGLSRSVVSDVLEPQPSLTPAFSSVW